MARAPRKSRRFKYNLESVLTFRNIRESQEQDKFNVADKKYRRERDKETQMKDQEQQEHLGLVHHLSEGKTIDFQQVMMRKAHLEQLKEEIIEQVQVRERAEDEKNVQRDVLIQAMKEKKVLEEDKKKKKDQWKHVMKKEEMKFLDDIASIGHIRQQRQAQDDMD